jgi:hypothetical protein
VLGLVAAAYSGVPAAGFVWDDHAIFERNHALDQPTFEKIFLRDLWCCTVSNNTGYYRPLLTLTFLLDRAVAGGIDAAVAHVQSLAWHLVVVALVAALLRPRIGALRANVAALMFGLHPIQSEAVVWISARNDLLAAAGVLAALTALDRGRIGLAASAAFLACLSKENAFLLPVVAWCWRRAWGERLHPREIVAGGMALGAAFALRSQATLGGFSLAQSEIAFNAVTAGRAALTALGWLTWPWPLTTTASLYMAPPGVGGWLAALASAALLAAILWRGRGGAAWLLAFSAVVLAPSALGVRWYSTLGERYLYLSLFGILAALVVIAPRWRGWMVTLPIGVVAALGALHIRVPEWADEDSLFTAAVARAPDGYAWNLLGVELGRQSRWAEATTAYDAAIRATPVQKRACAHVVEAADRVMDDATLAAATERWAEAGCRGHAGYDGAQAMTLAARGRWDEAARVATAARRNDDRRRDEIVRAALDLRDGDFTAFGVRGARWTHGAVDLLDQVTWLTQASGRRDPVAVDGSGGRVQGAATD